MYCYVFKKSDNIITKKIEDLSDGLCNRITEGIEHFFTDYDYIIKDEDLSVGEKLIIKDDIYDLIVIALKKLNDKCAYGVLAPFMSDASGEEHQYSYDLEAQKNFTTVEQALKYYPDDYLIPWRIHDTREVKYHTKTQFIKLFLDSCKHVQENINRFRELEQKIEQALTAEEIDELIKSW